MKNIWRITVPVAMVGGLLAAGAAPAVAATPAAYTVTINATSPHYPTAVRGKVDGFALVVYKAGNGLNTGKISGKITGAVANDVVTLLAKPFGATSFAPIGTPIPLPTPLATQPYSFNVHPSVATKYEVQVSTGTTVDQTSASATVYVVAGGRLTRARTSCTNGHCTSKLRGFILVPTALAYRTESPKHWFLYLTLRSAPRFIPLSRASTASRARKVTPREFAVRFTFRFNSSNPHPFPIEFGCIKDTEAKDGLGLPGHHGCGAPRISVRARYIG